MTRLIIDNNEYTDVYYQDAFDYAVKEGQEKYGYDIDEIDFYFLFDQDTIERYFYEQVSYEDEDLEKMFEATVKIENLAEDESYIYSITYIMQHRPDEDEDHWYFDNESMRVERKEK